MEKPKIRFKGYQEDWEQRKLGDIASSFEYGLNAAAKEYDGENKYIRITDIDDNTHEFLTDNLTSPDIDLTGADNYKLTEGDILFARTGASVGKSYIYRNSDGLVYYAGFLIRARIKEEYDAEFVFQNTLTDRYNKYIAVTSQRSGQPGVNAQEYAEFEIEVPKKEEQTKIGTYFRNIDHLITLHQRKCEEMKTLKKYMLQKMFPQNGQLVPQIRFSGFTEDWEQRKLGELGSLKNGMNFSKEAMGVGYPFVNLQNIFGNNVIDVSDLGKAMASDSQLKDYNLINGDVLFVRSSVKLEGVGEAALVPQTLENTTYSGFIIRFRDEYGLDNNFKRFVFGIDSVRNQIMSQATNSANKNISQSVLENLELAIPSKSEQQKIGAYFSNLDYLITLHQQKCDELRNIKKFMLQNMFI